MKKLLPICSSTFILLSLCAGKSISVGGGKITEQQYSLTKVAADSYISMLFPRKSSLGKLSLDDVYGADFSNTPLARVPLADTFLKADGHIISGKAPIITAYKVISLMDVSDKAMTDLYNSGDFYDVNGPDFTKKTIVLNFSDQYLYKIEVPGVGYIGEATSSTDAISQEGNVSYSDVLLLNPYQKIEDNLTTLNNVAQEPLLSLPVEMRAHAPLSSLSATKLYWADIGAESSRKIFICNEKNEFTDIKNKKIYKFVENRISTQSDKKYNLGINLNGIRGTLVEVNHE